MGSARAGKTSLVGQFLYAAYSPRYRPTVEDMHTVELDCQGESLILFASHTLYYRQSVSIRFLFNGFRTGPSLGHSGHGWQLRVPGYAHVGHQIGRRIHPSLRRGRSSFTRGTRNFTCCAFPLGRFSKEIRPT